MSKTAYASFPKIRQPSLDEQLTHISEGIQSTIRDDSETQTKTLRPKYTTRLKTKKEMNEKEITSILEDFKTLYPIKDPNFQAVITNSIHKDTNVPQFNKTFTSTFKGGFNTGTIPTIENQGLHGIRHLKPHQKQEMFKQAIYNKLIPPKQRAISSRVIHVSKSKKYEEEKTSTKYGPFLNSDNEIFNKRIEIANPLIKKHLESINFFGPYYSYCPPCRNRNIEFYNNLEPNQCIEIIKCVKKEQKKKTAELEEHYKKELKSKVRE